MQQVMYAVLAARSFIDLQRTAVQHTQLMPVHVPDRTSMSSQKHECTVQRGIGHIDLNTVVANHINHANILVQGEVCGL